MIALSLVVGARAQCDGSALETAIARAELSFAEMDQSGFQSAVDEGRSALGCMTDVLGAVECAGFHRMQALDAFLRLDHAHAVTYFQAMRGTQPGYLLSEDIAPIGHPLRLDYDKSGEFANDSRFDLPPPASGWLTVDGARQSTAPANRPYLFQWLDDTGAPLITAWVEVGAPIPSYEVRVEPPPPVVEEIRRRDPALASIGITTAAVGVGLYSLAFVSGRDYREAVEAGDEGRILSAHQTTNALTLTGLALLGSGATLAVVGVF